MLPTLEIEAHRPRDGGLGGLESTYRTPCGISQCANYEALSEECSEDPQNPHAGEARQSCPPPVAEPKKGDVALADLSDKFVDCIEPAERLALLHHLHECEIAHLSKASAAQSGAAACLRLSRAAGMYPSAGADEARAMASAAARCGNELLSDAGHPSAPITGQQHDSRPACHGQIAARSLIAR